MPLKSGSSQAVVQENIEEMVHSLLGKGRSPNKAREMAVAAAMQKAKKNRKKKRN